MQCEIVRHKSGKETHWSLLLKEDGKSMFYLPGGFEEAIKAYETFMGREITEEELGELQIA